MKQGIVNYHQDELGDWVAELNCGHYQHIRHNPPWNNRLWVTSKQGRALKIGFQLKCRKCVQGLPKDAINN